MDIPGVKKLKNTATHIMSALHLRYKVWFLLYPQWIHATVKFFFRKGNDCDRSPSTSIRGPSSNLSASRSSLSESIGAMSVSSFRSCSSSENNTDKSKSNTDPVPPKRGKILAS